MKNIVNINGQDYLVSVITAKCALGCTCVISDIRSINGVNVVSSDYTTSTTIRNAWKGIDDIKVSVISHNRHKNMLKNAVSPLNSFAYRSCDDKAVVIRVDSPEYRAARRLKNLCPELLSFYKEGTFFGMEPKEEADTYWVMFNNELIQSWINYWLK